ncbi:hypothetical protein GUITHDRAFT_152240 [Guillardia theta CCMP2712]|uniref:U6 snRNA-associated Sm-like protein LSm1 n=2 Tax=Guillardia theta TaxID=55529 RepID=L1JFH7_GUITC|nr:hypothetical protein GUITHDRAFT_152240 [Guillardia theta CCMP2712]EKX46894.1 hypothetical protein GUITHDRAFT_152240 [Guillardia theta CCMP2712]|eukprot:XP_005833874.1 hypothetical protein GUITHDRAFT_152240 [Guillardia theta CCMP2712]
MNNQQMNSGMQPGYPMGGMNPHQLHPNYANMHGAPADPRNAPQYPLRQQQYPMESHSPGAAPNDFQQGDYGMDRGSGGGLFDFLPGVASLVEDLDKRVLVTLRDGRHFVGFMRSFDQYGNVVLEDAFERHVVGNSFADERMGLYVIRGENLVLLAELDMHKEQNQPKLREVPLQTIMAQKAALKHEKAEDELLRKKLSAQALGLGFEDCL